MDLPVAANDPAIRFVNVNKRFAPTRGNHGTVALAGINMAVPRGSVFGVIGRSGAGKSTLLRLVNGLEQPSSGQVVVDGQAMGGLRGALLREQRRRIGMIFQHFNLLSSATVAANIALPMQLAGLRPGDIRHRTNELLDLVGLGTERNRYPVALSGGQKQRVGIARALACRPDILLCDEATSALDPETTASILALLRRINRELDVTILLITHEMEVVRAICDRVAVMEAGRIVESGLSAPILRQPREAATHGLLAAAGLVEDHAATARALARTALFKGHRLLVLELDGRPGSEALVARLASQLGLEALIAYARTRQTEAGTAGTLILALPPAEPHFQAALAYLRPLTARLEVIDHVAPDLRAVV